MDRAKCTFGILIYLKKPFDRVNRSILLAKLESYLNNRVFLSRNYRLIVAPRKFEVLKTNICPRSELSFEGKYASFKNIKFPRGNYQTDSSET